MPLYQYQCKMCQSEFEALVRGDERPECPDCESADLLKQLSKISPGMASQEPMGRGRGGCCQMDGGACRN